MVPFPIGESYAGEIPIANSSSSELFFWFFPSTNPAASNEIVLWLNGGPGCSKWFWISVWDWFLTQGLGRARIDPSFTLQFRALFFKKKFSHLYQRQKQVKWEITILDRLSGWLTSREWPLPLAEWNFRSESEPLLLDKPHKYGMGRPANRRRIIPRCPCS